MWNGCVGEDRKFCGNHVPAPQPVSWDGVGRVMVREGEGEDLPPSTPPVMVVAVVVAVAVSLPLTLFATGPS